jgi:hypothetical protein
VTDLARSTRALIIPGSGQLIDLDDPTDVLTDAVTELAGLIDAVREARQAVIDEVAARLDRNNSRTTSLELSDGSVLFLETNAPTTEEFVVDEVRSAFGPLVQRGVLDAAVVERLIKFPPPKPVEPRVDRREVNKLRKSSVPGVREALDKVTRTVDQRRTLKVDRKST